MARAVFLCLFVLLVTSCDLLNEDQTWNKKAVEATLKVSIPKHARNVSYEGHTGLEAVLDLRFEAPPEEVAQFTSHFCKGELIQSFDPFNRIIVETESSYTHRINMGWFIYYAYSPNTPGTLYGIRCPLDRLTVDQRDPDLYEVHLVRDFVSQHADEYPGEVITPPIADSSN